MPQADGWPCFNRYAGVTAPCNCRRFFEEPCDTAPFYEFASDTLQTHAQWIWANDVHWLEHWYFAEVSCSFWQKYNSIVAPKNFTLDIFDNPYYEPPLFPEPFRVSITCQNLTVDFQSKWYFVFDYGSDGPLPRNFLFVVGQDAWFPESLNTPNAVRPLGEWRFYPRMCQPSWEPNHDPQ